MRLIEVHPPAVLPVGDVVDGETAAATDVPSASPHETHDADRRQSDEGHEEEDEAGHQAVVLACRGEEMNSAISSH